jgi:hypothetical protein
MKYSQRWAAHIGSLESFPAPSLIVDSARGCTAQRKKILSQVAKAGVIVGLSPKLHPVMERTLWSFEPVWLGDSRDGARSPQSEQN